MRIGTNHGSLSDRILSRYGDTPEGMVESAMEFLNICRKHNFHDIVLSMKASNTLVMVQAYRLLMATMAKHGMNYPIHLGVTEAGDGEDGRIKSAVGIGALLEDGIGDTVRVSLTEAPEAEIPVAQKLVDKFQNDHVFPLTRSVTNLPYDPYAYHRYETHNIGKVGSGSVPVVVADVSEIDEVKPSHLFGYGYMYSVPLDKWNLSDSAADFLYIGNKALSFEVPGTLQVLCDFDLWDSKYRSRDGFFPILDVSSIEKVASDQTFFLRLEATIDDITFLKKYPNCVVVLESEYANKAQLYRNIYLKFAESEVKNPVILTSEQQSEDIETFQLWTSSDLGVSFIDGFGDGIWLKGNVSSQIINATSFGILQATRTRISKTEYISCPSCGRTLFDLQETTAKIRAKTSHLKGVKIGIMGCIVNGPGEMADADYGYVGTGPGKIHLYKEKEVVRKNIPEDEAVDALIDLIREHGDWTEPALES
jgi:(E)-4-hydroxy-3-methylbut-2-enyl-diphosphate synthase